MTVETGIAFAMIGAFAFVTFWTLLAAVTIRDRINRRRTPEPVPHGPEAEHIT